MDPNTPPPLGRLVLDDGRSAPLDRDLVIGREPHLAPEVQAGTAAPLPIEDDGQAISRVHARLTVNGGEVRLLDAGSANGTWRTQDGATEWERVEDPAGVVISPGTSILVGRRVLRFEAPQPLAPPPPGAPPMPPPGSPPPPGMAPPPPGAP